MSHTNLAGLSPTPEDGKIAGDGVFSEVRQALDKADLTLDYLIDKLKEELEVTQIRVFHYQGSLTESDPLIDWQTRQKARQDAHKLRGDYPAEKHDVGGEAFTSLAQYVEALEKASAITARVTDEPAKQPD